MTGQPSPTSTPGLRNNMYKRLVDDGSDLAGVFAYCIYKLHKRDFMRQIWAAHRRVPTDEEFSNFYMQCNLESSISMFYENGTSAADRFLQEHMIQVGNEEMEKLRREALFEELLEINKELKKTRSGWGWIAEGGRQVLASMVGIAIIGTLFVGIDRISKIHQALENIETEQTSTSNDTRSSTPPKAKGGSPTP